MKFDNFSIGDSFTTNPVIANKKDMINYAEKYDPQYFHIDENETKKQSVWFLNCIRILYDEYSVGRFYSHGYIRERLFRRPGNR